MTNIAEIVPSEHGRKVLHYLMSPRDTVYFHPALVATLAEGDGNATRSAGSQVRLSPHAAGVGRQCHRGSRRQPIQSDAIVDKQPACVSS